MFRSAGDGRLSAQREAERWLVWRLELAEAGVFPSGSDYRPRMRSPQTRKLTGIRLRCWKAPPRLDGEPNTERTDDETVIFDFGHAGTSVAGRNSRMRGAGETAGLSATTATSTGIITVGMRRRSHPSCLRLQPVPGWFLLFQ
jgi:hypothetical protein